MWSSKCTHYIGATEIPSISTSVSTSGDDVQPVAPVDEAPVDEAPVDEAPGIPGLGLEHPRVDVAISSDSTQWIYLV